MKFEKKTVEEISKMSPEEKEKYFADKEAHDASERKKETDEAVKKALESFKKDNVDEIAENVSVIEEKLKVTNEAGEVDLRKAVFDWVTENHEEIIKTFKAGGKMDISKAVGTVTTANGTLPTALPANFVAERTGVPNVRLRRPYLFDIVNSFRTAEKTLAYVEAVPGEGDFAVVAEGGTKPQLDLDWVTNYVNPTKFAGWIHVTDEVLYDIPRMTDLIVNYLKSKHDIFKDNQIFAYINANSTAFATGTGMAASVASPNIIDVVNALQVQVLNTPNYTDDVDAYVDTVLLNPLDFFKYFATVKDAMGRNLYSDQMMLGGSMVYNGLRFISTKQVTAGNIIAFDSSKIDVTEYEPYHVEMGWINDDFIKNQRVILGESRGHIYIKKHDLRAFVKGSIDAIVADLEKPA